MLAEIHFSGASMPQKSCSAADRYVSFKGIDFDGNVGRVLAHLARCRTEDPDNRLIAYLDRQRSSRQGARRDDLLLLHSLVNPVRDLFEARGDEAALRDLDRLERECF
jgi:N(2)-fixation sustaining protein CowN